MRKVFACLTVFFFSLQVLGQNRTIKGRITDAQGKAVEFATISIKGQAASGTSADVNGNYSIQAPANSTLVFTAAGFQLQELNTGDRTAINVILNATGTLTEVVVTALGIKRADRALGYSVSKVDP